MHDLTRQVAVSTVVALHPSGVLYLVVDDTLLRKRGKTVCGLGWFRDAVASTAKRVATASGNHWVVVGLAIRIPGSSEMYCLPIHAMLHLAGKKNKSEATLARKMLQDILQWSPDREFVVVGDGAYSVNNLLGDLHERVTYVGVMRADAAHYDVTVPKQAIPVGVAAAKHHQLVVFHGGPQTPASPGRTSAFWRLRHGMVAGSSAPHAACGNPGQHN